MRRGIRIAAVVAAPAWTYIAVVYALDAFNPDANILYNNVDLGITFVRLLVVLLVVLFVPLSAIVAVVAPIERLLARRWAWRALLPALAVGCVVLGAWVETSNSLTYQMETLYGWPSPQWQFVKECGIALAFAMGALLEGIIVYRFTPAK